MISEVGMQFKLNVHVFVSVSKWQYIDQAS